MCILGVESVEFPSAQEFTYISSTSSYDYTTSEKKKKRITTHQNQSSYRNKLQLIAYGAYYVDHYTEKDLLQQKKKRLLQQNPGKRKICDMFTFKWMNS